MAIKMEWLSVIYVAAAVFGAGVTLMDLLGVLGHGVHGAGGHDTGGHPVDGEGAGAGHDAGGHPVDDSLAGGGHDGHIAGAGHELPAGHGSSHADGTQHSSIVSQDPRLPRLNLGLRSLAAARTLVYFCLGLGPIGWIAIARGSTPSASLLWGLPAGVLFAAVGLGLRRLQRSVLDSQVREEELLMEPARVIVPITAGQIGKVRIIFGGRNVERYARARDASQSFPTGASVRIVSLTDEGVVVSEI